MRVNVEIPQTSDLVTAHNDLLGDRLSSEKLARYIQWSRFDARLLEILAQYFSDHYPKLNPFDVNGAIRKTPWPSALGVALEHARYLVKQKDPRRAALFDHWTSICMSGIVPAKGELFFIGLFDFNSKRINKMISRPSRLFKKWGFFHDEIVLNKAEKIGRTTVSKKTRLQALKKLLRTKGQVTVEAYRRALNFQVSVRQAQRDLKELAKI